MAHYKVLNLIDFLWKICTIMTREFVICTFYIYTGDKIRENAREAEKTLMDVENI